MIKNIVHCTTAGAVGSWWFVATPQDPVWGAFRRACTTSFGSICLGSLIVAVLSAIRAMINAARRNRRGRGSVSTVHHAFFSTAAATTQSYAHGSFVRVQILLSCAGCFVGCVERLMEYFNHWAFIEVALYGKDFKTAGKDAMRIFKVGVDRCMLCAARSLLYVTFWFVPVSHPRVFFRIVAGP